jgi:hypothetical protein
VNERIQRLIDLGRLAHEDAPDEEVAGLWANALQDYQDARLSGASPRSRLKNAYDAGRIAALAITRCHDLRVHAPNHHEITIVAAHHLLGGEGGQSLASFQSVRDLRAELQYGWQRQITMAEVERITALVRAILEHGARHIRAQRPHLKNRIKLP